jgi:hypothetical protein
VVSDGVSDEFGVTPGAFPSRYNPGAGLTGIAIGDVKIPTPPTTDRDRGWGWFWPGPARPRVGAGGVRSMSVMAWLQQLLSNSSRLSS